MLSRIMEPLGRKAKTRRKLINNHCIAILIWIEFGDPYYCSCLLRIGNAELCAKSNTCLYPRIQSIHISIFRKCDVNRTSCYNGGKKIHVVATYAVFELRLGVPHQRVVPGNTSVKLQNEAWTVRHATLSMKNLFSLTVWITHQIPRAK